jgi:hypothetical protein
MDWRQVQFVRLDDKPLKPDIEVLVAPKEHSQEAQDLLHIGKTMTEMKATSSALLRKYNDMFNGRPSMFAPGYDEWNQRMIAARNEWQAASHALARYKESPDGQRLAKAGNAFPFLDPTKNRL